MHYLYQPLTYLTEGSLPPGSLFALATLPLHVGAG